jgi:hypothetical protein
MGPGKKKKQKALEAAREARVKEAIECPRLTPQEALSLFRKCLDSQQVTARLHWRLRSRERGFLLADVFDSIDDESAECLEPEFHRASQPDHPLPGEWHYKIKGSCSGRILCSVFALDPKGKVYLVSGWFEGEEP